jgi:hypothetical protein
VTWNISVALAAATFGMEHKHCGGLKLIDQAKAFFLGYGNAS